MVGALAQNSLKAIIVELNGQGRRYGFSDEAVVALIERAGFVSANYDPLTRELVLGKPKRGTSDNVLYVRDLEFVSVRVRSAAHFGVLGQTI